MPRVKRNRILLLRENHCSMACCRKCLPNVKDHYCRGHENSRKNPPNEDVFVCFLLERYMTHMRYGGSDNDRQNAAGRLDDVSINHSDCGEA